MKWVENPSTGLNTRKATGMPLCQIAPSGRGIGVSCLNRCWSHEISLLVEEELLKILLMVCLVSTIEVDTTCTEHGRCAW